MFTGIVQEIGMVRKVKEGHLGYTILLEVMPPSKGAGFYGLGESVAVNGVCLTVRDIESRPGADLLTFDVSVETLKRSNLSQIRHNDMVNIERALPVSGLPGRLSGHVVQGHVDGMGRVARVQALLSLRNRDNSFYDFIVEIPLELSRYVVKKGSICINGISLTVNEIDMPGNSSCFLQFMIVPHTWENTNLHHLKDGDSVNIEVDVLAKYVEKLCTPYLK